MSDLGYRNTSQAAIQLCMNGLEPYIEGLERAIRAPWPAWERIGTQVDGEWRQLSTSVLQIENEYYGYIRPKQPILPGERPTVALRRAGVAYVEVRALDVSPFDPAGISQNELRFLEAFLVFCALHDSPQIDSGELDLLDFNHGRVAVAGRKPGLALTIGGRTQSLVEWGRILCRQLAPICRLLDRDDSARSYSAALELQVARLADAGLTPSARVLGDMLQEGESFYAFAMRMSRQHRDYFRSIPPMSAASLAAFTAEAAASLERQAAIEAADDLPFEEYLRHYFEGAVPAGG
jgi:glutamate--cysteine ligase